nr:cardiolipin synthase [uncultured Allomuricauda sp.]
MHPIVLTFYIIVTLWALLSIILHGTRPTKSLGWMLTVLIFPIGGPFIYYLFGVNRRKFKLFRSSRSLERMRRLQKSTQNFVSEKTNEQLEYKYLAQLLKNASKSSVLGDNQVTVLHDGQETFESLFKTLEKAQKFIHLQYYIFEKGEVQNQFYDLFKKKIKEGVEIRLLYDSFGSFAFRGKNKKRFENIGVELFPIMPIRFGNLLFSLNYRNHRKIVIVDGKIGFTGGVNISDKYVTDKDELGRWRDIHAKIEGPAVNRLHQVFLEDFSYAKKEGDSLFTEKYLPKSTKKGNTFVQIISSGPDSKFPGVMMQYMGMMNAAKKEICICNPYFIPDQSVLNSITMAALRGVTVKLLVPKTSDSILAKYSMYSNFELLLKAGVQIFLRDDFTHSKLMVVDQYLTSIGSGNFDYRSFEHNFETNTLVYDKSLAQEVLLDFEHHMKNAEELDFKSFRERPIQQRFLEGIAKLFAPLL